MGGFCLAIRRLVLLLLWVVSLQSNIYADSECTNAAAGMGRASAPTLESQLVDLTTLGTAAERATARLQNVSTFNKFVDPEHGQKIVAEVVPSLETARLYPRIVGRIPKNATVRILLLHGNGSSRSNKRAMRNIMRIMTEPGKRGKLTQTLRTDFPEIIPAIEAPDLPGCADGPNLADYDTADRAIEWLADYVKMMKAETPDLPFWVVTRSSSAALISEVNARYPELITGLIHMSPTMPGDSEILHAGISEVFRLAEVEKAFTLNRPSLIWIDKILTGIHWSVGHFGGKPVFLLTGEKDGQVVEAERGPYRLLATTSSNIEYRDYPHMGHDVLSLAVKENADIAAQAYNDIFKFIRANTHLKRATNSP